MTVFKSLPISDLRIGEHLPEADSSRVDESTLAELGIIMPTGSLHRDETIQLQRTQPEDAERKMAERHELRQVSWLYFF